MNPTIIQHKPAGRGTATHLRVQTATRTEEPFLINTLSSAFYHDPVVRWIFPDPRQYSTHFPELVRRFGGQAFERNTALRIEGRPAAALWLPPGTGPDEEGLVALLQRAVSPDRLPHVFAVFEQMNSFHPPRPHWYLPLVGVDPSQQGQGLGSALLQHALDRCDREGVIAYLESSHPRNIPLYERHGFLELGEIQAGDSPTIVPMLRPPNR